MRLIGWRPQRDDEIVAPKAKFRKNRLIRPEPGDVHILFYSRIVEIFRLAITELSSIMSGAISHVG